MKNYVYFHLLVIIALFVVGIYFCLKGRYIEGLLSFILLRLTSINVNIMSSVNKMK
jgi:hypothetical protein